MFEIVHSIESCTVLVVDDAKAIRKLVSAILKPVCRTVSFESAETALKVCHKIKPDLIIMDINLEGMSGLQACKELKSQPDLADIPVIFITASQEPQVQEKCWDAGAVDFIEKPLVASTLVKRISTHLKYKVQADILTNQSFVDGLTELYNRRFFDIEIDRLLKDSLRRRVPLALLLIDIDFFKKFNDSQGHLEGDKALKDVTRQVSLCTQRPVDLVCRYGGEEIAVLLPDTSVHSAQEFASKVVQSVAKLAIAHPTSPHNFVTVSVGLSCTGSAKATTPAKLIEQADAALYNAKESGRNQYQASMAVPSY
ncbi:diguanylate cyclase [Pseudoalteromonas ardens]|uniref:diguanylate cyclase n=1 Tax=Pseudoalteromonas rubra TaxID=43658 RepID=A0A0L0ELD1_9GAMM|nr:diguanylate cyclase [Pseudoalteromonas sp. R96]KNC65257.1 histidine kinase [Pseudoalteromonas rubra]MDK1312934.1 diguanylate cyclase [Pseudoalteromonas sp. R96]